MEYMKKQLHKMWLLAICTLCAASSFAQSTPLKGRVVDEEGVAIIGATVFASQTNQGTVTDIDGSFSLNVAPKTVVNISFLGYETQSVELTQNVVVKMVSDSKELEEVVVIGYGSVRKKEVTGAVARVDSEDIMKITTSDLGNAIQGMVAGVSVTADSGAPGSASSVVIRGYSSISGDNTPLYVVDGVPQEDDPRISSNEIESIDFLKDAASAAIYGTRGAAGVILITTKAGAASALKVSFDATMGMRNITSQDYLMDATQHTYFDLVYDRTTAADSGLAYSDEDTILDITKSNSRFYNNTSLLDDVFVDNAITQNYSVTLSGGSKELKYSVVAGYYDEEGSIVNSSFDRFNTRARLNYDKNKFDFGVNATYKIENLESAKSDILLQSLRYNPTSQPLSSADAVYNSGSDSENSYMSGALVSFYATDVKRTNSTAVNFTVGYDILPTLKFNGIASFSDKNALRNEFVPYIEVLDSDGKSSTSYESSYVKTTMTNNRSSIFEGGFSYKESFGDHNLSAVAVATKETYTYEGFYARKECVADNSVTNLSTALDNPEAEALDGYTNVLIGTIGRISYDWKSRYMFSASVRVDGSSKFSAENRWGVFPSASAAWNVSDESFFKPVKSVMNNFKLRASYGTTGNQNFSAYSYENYLENGYDTVYGTGSGSLGYGTTQTEFVDTDIKWETTRQINVGADLGFFRSRLTFSAEYYKSNKEDMLFPILPPGSSGSTSKVTMNIGNMTNEGYELSANYRINKKKYNLILGATFSTNTNLVTKIDGDGMRYVAYTTGMISGSSDRSSVNYIAEGYEAGAFLLYPTNGIIKTEEQLTAYQQINPDALMGDLIYVDSDGNGEITDEDRVYCGSGLSEYEIGFTLSFNYKNFDFYANLYSALGHEIINGSRITAFTYGRHIDLLNAYDPITNPDSDLPTYRGDGTTHDNYRADTDMWVEDGSYLRLKNITLGYTVPKKISNRIGVGKARFYLSAQNLFTLTNYTGYDPEVGGSITTRGLDTGRYPTFRTFMCGLNISL